MQAIWSILMMYLFTVPMALVAFHFGRKMLRLREPPEGTMRTPQLGRPVTDPAEKLALAHSTGRIYIMAGVLFLVGPVVVQFIDFPPPLTSPRQVLP